MRAFTLVAVLATARASEDCEVIDLPGSLKLDFSTSELLWNNLGGLGPNDCGTVGNIRACPRPTSTG